MTLGSRLKLDQMRILSTHALEKLKFCPFGAILVFECASTDLPPF